MFRMKYHVYWRTLEKKHTMSSNEGDIWRLDPAPSQQEQDDRVNLKERCSLIWY